MRDNTICDECSLSIPGILEGAIKVCGIYLCPRCGAAVFMFPGIRSGDDWEEIENAQEEIRKRPENKPYLGTKEGIWKTMPGLHKEVAIGTIRIIRFLASHPEEKAKILPKMIPWPLFENLLSIGQEGLQLEESRNYIFNWLWYFGEIPDEVEKQVLEGNYTEVWKAMNRDLMLFNCYGPVVPEPINI